MEPCAEWRRAPGDPLSVGVWAIRSALENMPSVLWNTLLVVLAIGVAAGVCAVCFAFSTVPPLELPAWRSSRKPRRAPSCLGDLVAMPGPGPGYPVVLRVFEKGIQTGQDEGMVVFTDGWLVYEGRRTSFSLLYCDGIPVDVGEARGRLPDGREVEFLAYDRIGDRTDLRDAFEGAMRRWRRHPAPLGLSVLPPRTVQARAQGQAVGAMLAGLTLVGLASAGLFVGGIAGWIVGGVVAVCGVWRVGCGVRHLYVLLGIPIAGTRSV